MLVLETVVRIRREHASGKAIKAIARDQRDVLSVSIATPEVAGIRDVALSIPRVVGAEGVVVDLFPDLDDEEYAALNRSASLLKERADAIPL